MSHMSLLVFDSPFFRVGSFFPGRLSPSSESGGLFPSTFSQSISPTLKLKCPAPLPLEKKDPLRRKVPSAPPLASLFVRTRGTQSPLFFHRKFYGRRPASLAPLVFLDSANVLSVKFVVLLLFFLEYFSLSPLFSAAFLPLPEKRF